jgi:hypothetical protein
MAENEFRSAAAAITRLRFALQVHHLQSGAATLIVHMRVVGDGRDGTTGPTSEFLGRTVLVSDDVAPNTLAVACQLGLTQQLQRRCKNRTDGTAPAVSSFDSQSSRKAIQSHSSPHDTR